MRLIFAFFIFEISLVAAPKQLLVLGQKPDGHPPGTHEYMPGARIVKALMAGHEDVKVTISQADEPWIEGPKLIAKADGIVMFLNEGGRFIQDDPKRAKAFADFAKRGGGLVAYHWGIGARDAKLISPFLKLFGGCHGGVNSAAMATAFGLGPNQWHTELAPTVTSITELEILTSAVRGRRWLCRRYNDSAHLHGTDLDLRDHL